MWGIQEVWYLPDSPASVCLFNQVPPCATTDQRARSPGKTKFLSFLLPQLLSVRQVILLYNTTETYLFYRGQAYSRPTGFGLKYFPTRAIKRYYCPIWALIDMDCTGRRPPINKSLNIWPIQASSPNPARWKLWKKQYNATLFGMPLWTMEELIAGYV